MPQHLARIEEKLSDRLTDDAKSVIRANLQKKFRSVFDRRVGKNIVDEEDLTLIIYGLAMRFTQKEILSEINTRRAKAGKSSILISSFEYYRKKYADVIDEVYAVTILRVSEIYKYADKVVRIAKISEMSAVIQNEVMTSMTVEGLTDMNLKGANTFLRFLNAMNQELGDVPVAKLIKYTTNKENNANNGDDNISLTEHQVKELMEKTISEQYKNQLPPSIAQQIQFDDYTICAWSDKVGAVYTCSNDKMTEGNSGAQCVVQAGKCSECPKFLNKTLLNNASWLETARDRGCTVGDIARLVGCRDHNLDTSAKVTEFLKKHEVSNRDPKLLGILNDHLMTTQTAQKHAQPIIPEYPINGEENRTISEPT